jgi:hypothetical protein
VCSRLEPDPFGLRAAAGTRTTVRQRRQRVFVIASVSKLNPQRLQVMVVTAPIIAPFRPSERRLIRLVRRGLASAISESLNGAEY